MLNLTRRLFPALPSARPFSLTARWRNDSDVAPNLPEGLSEGEQLLYTKLYDKYTPSKLQVQDISGGCGTFYAITIASPVFQGLSILKQHKHVTDTLKSEIKGFHGLQIKTFPT